MSRPPGDGPARRVPAVAVAAIVVGLTWTLAMCAALGLATSAAPGGAMAGMSGMTGMTGTGPDVSPTEAPPGATLVPPTTAVAVTSGAAALAPVTVSVPPCGQPCVRTATSLAPTSASALVCLVLALLLVSIRRAGLDVPEAVRRGDAGLRRRRREHRPWTVLSPVRHGLLRV